MSRHAVTPPSRWTTVHTLDLPTRAARVVPADTLPVDPRLAEWLAAVCPGGVYTHQGAAITAAVEGRDVCLVTGTASGKTLAFHAAALESLVKDPEARVIAIYPQKSLASQQLDRWARALSDVGLPAPVRIDGDMPVDERLERLDTARVVIMTPDSLHCWLMAHLAQPIIQRFLRSLSLFILDELHVYTGVMGTNCAYVLRRLQHAHHGLGGAGIRFFAASATIREPARHMEQLTGRPPVLVGEEEDGSPRHPVTIHLIRPPQGTDRLRELPTLVDDIVARETRFLMFCDSRKQTELVATLHQTGRRDASQQPTDDETDDVIVPAGKRVLPYRAGYEPAHRKHIERALHDGTLLGVVCTSAMELGLDIPGLDLAVLVGVPNSVTSLRQRIGRIGRSGPGTVWIIDGESQLDRAVFKDPASLLHRPPVEGALYMENANIQYMQALCFARRGTGEYDVVHGRPDATVPSSPVPWPDGFLALCARERAGELTVEQRTLRNAAEERPHLAFPLRDTGLPFRIHNYLGKQKLGDLGSGLSHGQVMRETYPGAVYLHSTLSYRVLNVSLQRREVRVRRERGFTYTKPCTLPIEVQPNLTAGALHRLVRGTTGVLLEADAYIRETITGFAEKRGSASHTHSYPNDYYDRPYFTRHFETTATLLWVPAFDQDEAGTHSAVERLAELLYEALLGIAPFDRMDLGVAVTRYRGTTEHLAGRARFIAIYDQTVGSLRLSGRLIEAVLSGQLVQQARWLHNAQEAGTRNAEVEALLQALESEGASWRERLVEADAVAVDSADHLVDVLAPGSWGLKVDEQHREVKVERVVYSPKFGALMYQYTIPGGTKVAGQVLMTPVAYLVGVPGKHQVAQYNMELGEIV